MASRLPIITAKLNAFKAAVPTGKTDRLSMNSVNEFNRILADIRANYPNHVADLPKDFDPKSKLNSLLGQTDVFGTDLVYAITMTLAVIEVIESTEQK